MFQTFHDLHDPSCGAPRAALLRKALQQQSLDGFLIPRADAHQGEYVPPSESRLQWLTGFSGSAGVAVVFGEDAAIFVDGRYTLQAQNQVDTSVFPVQHLANQSIVRWLASRLKPGQRFGYDPMLHTMSEIKKLKAACQEAGAELVGVDANPVDAVWEDRPEPPLGAVSLHDEKLAGQSAVEKLKKIQKAIMDGKSDACVLTQPESIAWLLNIRGSDIPRIPSPLSFAVVPSQGKPSLFIDGRKLSNFLRSSLEDLVVIEEPDGFLPSLERLGKTGAKVMLDPALTGQVIADTIVQNGGTVVEATDPVMLPRAVKNNAEIDGARAAHIRDGAAVVRFLRWFDDIAPSGELDEIGAAEKLEQYRRDTGVLKDLAFDTISAAGPNGAICHYHVTKKTNLLIPVGKPFLIDSGAQYEDGTTDITRTIAVGDQEDDVKRNFTLVLKGHIAISTARFPEGTTGAQIDALARIALWKSGLDYDHGTGHGIGSYLSVHEGPQRISKAGHEPLRSGMIVSNEPGYYAASSYGIRLENLELVTSPRHIPGGERPMLGFETLTLAPFDLRLVKADLLTEDERHWLNSYHASVLETLSDFLDDRTLTWLEDATRPI